MSEHSTEVIQSQLKILIDDFQRYREHQEKDRDADRKVRGEMYKSLNECNIKIAKVETSLNWHRRIGATIVGAITVAIGYQFNR